MGWADVERCARERAERDWEDDGGNALGWLTPPRLAVLIVVVCLLIALLDGRA